jgi:phage gp45-like
MNALQNQIDRLYRRILMNVAPAKILATDDTGPIHRVQVNLNGGPEIVDQLPVMQHYGLNAHAPVGSAATALFIAGQRSNPVIVATGNQKARLRNLKPGEVALYTDEGDSLHFARGQALTVNAGNSFGVTTKAATIKGSDTVTLDSPVVHATKDLTAAGKVDASGGFFQNGNPIGGGSGSPGPPGPAGPAATIAVGTTTTGAPGTPAAVTNAGSSSAAVFDFTIPAGVAGAAGAPGAAGNAATIAVGTTTTGAAGTAAAVTNSGSSSAAVFNFTIPQGVAGATGPQGPPGPGTISGLTTGQLPIAASATTLTSSIAYGTTGNSTIVETTPTGTLAAGVMPAYTGDVASPAGSTVNTLASVNANVGTFQGITFDAKGRSERRSAADLMKPPLGHLLKGSHLPEEFSSRLSRAPEQYGAGGGI